MSTTEQQRILIVDTNPLFLERLARGLRDRNFDVVAAASGAQAFHVLRDWHRPIHWLFTRATLPGLIDGWILADEYRDNHPHRAAVIAASQTGVSAQGHIILQDPSPAAVIDTMRCIMAQHQALEIPSHAECDKEPLAA
ncbi:response regulator (plasmid) [Microvirga sp. RSM25]|uniref:response regulator n=1 Tax=Microvirga sp. RSM25 TaxID=3273802 RepID=UPI0038513E7A